MVGSLSTAAGTMQSRERAPVFAMMAAEAISETGNASTNLAIPWFVPTTTGSAAISILSLVTTIWLAFQPTLGELDTPGFEELPSPAMSG
jgi:hypothetical protein